MQLVNGSGGKLTNPSIYLRVWGDLACFTRPEMKVERVSYPVMTPSAARGLLEAILYKPQFRWRIQRIAVKKPVEFLAFRRNEVKSRLVPRHPEPILADQDRTQRNTLALRDVEYVVEASLLPTSFTDRSEPDRKDTANADGGSTVPYRAVFQRRAEKGQCFMQPCFGCREFPAHFELADASAMQVSSAVNPNTDLGLMLYDVFDLDALHEPGKITESRAKITFFPARLRDGVMDIPPWHEVKAQLERQP